VSDIRSTIYEDAVAIVPSDSAAQALSQPFAALLVTAAGTVKFKSRTGTITIAASLAAGTVLPINVVQVFATGTTATVMGLTAFGFKGAGA
jgi:hypothetical protein